MNKLILKYYNDNEIEVYSKNQLVEVIDKDYLILKYNINPRILKLKKILIIWK